MRIALPGWCLFAVTLSGCQCSEPVGNGDPLDGSRSDSSREGGTQEGGPRPDRVVPPPPDVHVRITGDNAYGFGYGDSGRLANYFLGREDGSLQIFDCSAACDASTPCAIGACDAFGTCNDDRLGAETYVVPGASALIGNYLYIVAWSDESVTQGVLGRFEAANGSGRTVYTGSDDWEVCATGMDFDIGSGGPSEDVINQQIGACNEGSTPSDGWLGTTPNANRALVIGEANEAGSGGAFREVCIDPTRGDSVPGDARWMWYDDDVTDARDAFHSDGSPHDEFLIFRLSTAVILD